MVMLVIMIMGTAAFLVSALNSSSVQIERDKKTADALAKAKDSLIGFAVSVNLTAGCANTLPPFPSTPVTCPRPGDLPCPDNHTPGTALEGTSSTPCSGNALGRLPWKTLGLSDLRDGSGERLWYAVSAKFKNSPRTPCTNSNVTNCLNSDTNGSITVFGSDGSVQNAGNTSTGAVAVIIAPGEVLKRQGSSAMQNRSGSGVNTASNYLDIATVGGNTGDNASFVDGSAINGFIEGRVLDSTGHAIVNDQLLVITKYHIIPLLEKRVAAEVKNCITEYAALPQNQGPPPNQGYFPWATDRTISGGLIVYDDSDQLNFGHIPDEPFAQTCSDTGGSNCSGSSPSGGMKTNWGATCNFAISNWWVNWKEMTFYGFANSFRPHDLTHNHACSNSTCLVVDPPSAAVDKSFVVIVAGEKIGTQLRSTNAEKSTLSNYLESPNDLGASPFAQGTTSSTFNDTVVFQ